MNDMLFYSTKKPPKLIGGKSGLPLQNALRTFDWVKMKEEIKELAPLVAGFGRC